METPPITDFGLVLYLCLSECSLSPVVTRKIFWTRVSPNTNFLMSILDSTEAPQEFGDSYDRTRVAVDRAKERWEKLDRVRPKPSEAKILACFPETIQHNLSVLLRGSQSLYTEKTLLEHLGAQSMETLRILFGEVNRDRFQWIADRIPDQIMHDPHHPFWSTPDWPEPTSHAKGGTQASHRIQDGHIRVIVDYGWEQRLLFAQSLASQLADLHERGDVFGSYTLQDVSVDSDQRVTVSVDHADNPSLAPEHLLGGPELDIPSDDVFMFGGILHELFAEEGLVETPKEKLMVGERPMGRAPVPVQVALAVRDALHQDPEKRPSARQLQALLGPDWFRVRLEVATENQELKARCLSMGFEELYPLLDVTRRPSYFRPETSGVQRAFEVLGCNMEEYRSLRRAFVLRAILKERYGEFDSRDMNLPVLQALGIKTREALLERLLRDNTIGNVQITWGLLTSLTPEQRREILRPDSDPGSFGNYSFMCLKLTRFLKENLDLLPPSLVPPDTRDIWSTLNRTILTWDGDGSRDSLDSRIRSILERLQALKRELQKETPDWSPLAQLVEDFERERRFIFYELSLNKNPGRVWPDFRP